MIEEENALFAWLHNIMFSYGSVCIGFESCIFDAINIHSSVDCYCFLYFAMVWVPFNESDNKTKFDMYSRRGSRQTKENGTVSIEERRRNKSLKRLPIHKRTHYYIAKCFFFHSSTFVIPLCACTTATKLNSFFFLVFKKCTLLSPFFFSSSLLLVEQVGLLCNDFLLFFFFIFLMISVQISFV